MEKREPSYTVGGNVNLYSMENSMEVPKNTKLSYHIDPAIPRMGIYPEKAITEKDKCDPMFIAALFTIVKIWKQPKRLSTDEWVKKMLYIHTMAYYSAIKKNEIMPFAATWMDLEITILSKVSQTEKDKYHVISLIYRT